MCYCYKGNQADKDSLLQQDGRKRCMDNKTNLGRGSATNRKPVDETMKVREGTCASCLLTINASLINSSDFNDFTVYHI